MDETERRRIEGAGQQFEDVLRDDFLADDAERARSLTEIVQLQREGKLVDPENDPSYQKVMADPEVRAFMESINVGQAAQRMAERIGARHELRKKLGIPNGADELAIQLFQLVARRSSDPPSTK